MIAKQLFPGLYLLRLGILNAFLLDCGELTLIDAGVAGSEKRVLQALAELGRQPGDLRHILVTHLHIDHTGGLAALQKSTGAQVWMGAADAAAHRQGQAMRPVRPAPGLFNQILVAVSRVGRPVAVEPAPVAHELQGGEALDFAGGLQVIHLPGHTAGSMAFLWPAHGGVLFVGDAATRMFGPLSWLFIYEDFEEGRRSLQRLESLPFEAACFGHGKPILRGAPAAFKARFG
jgi:glyoxylase-like metal-dependent hydrolase (beta-lactamase superfamily II)